MVRTPTSLRTFKHVKLGKNEVPLNIATFALIDKLAGIQLGGPVAVCYTRVADDRLSVQVLLQHELAMLVRDHATLHPPGIAQQDLQGAL